MSAKKPSLQMLLKQRRQLTRLLKQGRIQTIPDPIHAVLLIGSDGLQQYYNSLSDQRKKDRHVKKTLRRAKHYADKVDIDKVNKKLARILIKSPALYNIQRNIDKLNLANFTLQMKKISYDYPGAFYSGLVLAFYLLLKLDKYIKSQQMNQSYGLFEQKVIDKLKTRLTQMIDVGRAQINSVKNNPIGVEALLTKNWVPRSQNVKPIYDRLNEFNQKFVNHIQGVFMTSNFILNWQRAKQILRSAVQQVRKQKKQTTPQNILNQIYDKIKQQGDLQRPTQSMNKIKQATQAYAQQISILSNKVRGLRNEDSQSKPGQKKITQQQLHGLNRRLDFIRQNLKKISDSYPELMVLTSPANKGKFYINLLMLFWGNRKLSDIQNIIDQVGDYNRRVQGYGFKSLQNKHTDTIEGRL